MLVLYNVNVLNMFEIICSQVHQSWEFCISLTYISTHSTFLGLLLTVVSLYAVEKGHPNLALKVQASGVTTGNVMSHYTHCSKYWSTYQKMKRWNNKQTTRPCLLKWDHLIISMTMEIFVAPRKPWCLKKSVHYIEFYLHKTGFPV